MMFTSQHVHYKNSAIAVLNKSNFRCQVEVHVSLTLLFFVICENVAIN